jgi:hypothetical protein
MKRGLRSIFFALLLILIMPYATSLIVSEVELNPAGTDSGNEWIELYNNNKINLDGYKILNGDGQELILNFTIDGYYVYTFKTQWLDNADEKIILKNNEGIIIFETKLLNDAYNNDKTWQYCNEEWKFEASTKNKENLCKTTAEKNTNNEEQEEKVNNKNEEKNEQDKTRENNKEQENTNQATITDRGQSQQTNINNSNNNIIKLGNSNLNSNKLQNSIIYKSKSEYIKQYLPYALGITCVILLILILVIKEKKQE